MGAGNKTTLSFVNKGFEGADELLGFIISEVKTISITQMGENPEPYNEKWNNIISGIQDLLEKAEEYGLTKEQIGNLKHELKGKTSELNMYAYNPNVNNNGEARVEFISKMSFLHKLIEKLDQAIGIYQERFSIDLLAEVQGKRLEIVKNGILNLINEMHWINSRGTKHKIAKIQGFLAEKEGIKEQILESMTGEDTAAAYWRVMESMAEKICGGTLYDLMSGMNPEESEEENETTRKQEVVIEIPYKCYSYLKRKQGLESEEYIGKLVEFIEKKKPWVRKNLGAVIQVKGDFAIKEDFARALEEKFGQPLSQIMQCFRYENSHRMSEESLVFEFFHRNLKGFDRSYEEDGESKMAYRIRMKYGQPVGRNVIVIPSIQKKIKDTLIQIKIEELTGCSLDECARKFLELLAGKLCKKENTINVEELAKKAWEETFEELVGESEANQGEAKVSQEELGEEVGKEDLLSSGQNVDRKVIVIPSIQKKIKYALTQIGIEELTGCSLDECARKFLELLAGKLDNIESAINVEDIAREAWMETLEELVEETEASREEVEEVEEEELLTSEEIIDKGPEILRIRRMKARYLSLDKSIERTMDQCIGEAQKNGIGEAGVNTLRQRSRQGGEAFAEYLQVRGKTDFGKYISDDKIPELRAIQIAYIHSLRMIDSAKEPDGKEPMFWDTVREINFRMLPKHVKWKEIRKWLIKEWNRKEGGIRRVIGVRESFKALSDNNEKKYIEDNCRVSLWGDIGSEKKPSPKRMKLGKIYRENRTATHEVKESAAERHMRTKNIQYNKRVIVRTAQAVGKELRTPEITAAKISGVTERVSGDETANAVVRQATRDIVYRPNTRDDNSR